jgi:hypothetical protein
VLGNQNQYSIHVGQDVQVRHPQDAKAMPLQDRSSLRIRDGFQVLAPIHLDDQVRLAAGEVGEERPNWELPDELVAIDLTVTKP